MPELYSEDYFEANYGQMVSRGAITPQIFNTLKRQYAMAYKNMCDAAGKLPASKDPTYDRIWIVWMLNYCEQYYLYVKLFRYLKKKGAVDFTEDELTYAWGMIKQRLDTQENQEESA
jgi:hypothetical protein